MPIDWSPLADVLARHDRFLVTTHVRPDGDALGSAVGMAGLLEARGKSARIVTPSPVSPRYDFLNDPTGRITRFGDPTATTAELIDYDALIILDLSSWPQLAEMADFTRQFPGTRVVIDHHVSHDDLNALVLKDTKAEATGILVFEAAQALDIPISPTMATGLMTALAMDTGWFRHPSTKPSTFRAAATLMEAGADVHAIYRRLFERNTPGRMKLLGKALSHLTFADDGRIAYATVTRSDFAATGAIPPETEDLIDYTVGIEGVEVGLLFIEQFKGGSKLSIRTRTNFDCAALAAHFGGGGHHAAAGANLPDPLTEMIPKVLQAVRRQWDETSNAPQ